MPNATRSAPRLGRTFLVPLLILGLAACERRPEEEAMPAGQPAGGAAPPAAETVPPGGTAAMLSPSEIGAVLTATDSAEILPSQLALEKSQNTEVRAYAQRMITDHGMLEDSLRALERQLNITPAQSTLSQQVQSQTQSTMQQLRGLSGAEFDRAYMEWMVNSHQAALSTVDNQLMPAARDPQIRTTLEQKVRPIIVGHLESAQSIHRMLAST